MKDMVVENEVFGNTVTMCSELTMIRKNLVVSDSADLWLWNAVLEKYQLFAIISSKRLWDLMEGKVYILELWQVS